LDVNDYNTIIFLSWWLSSEILHFV